MARDKGKKFIGPMGICECGHTGIGENSQHADLELPGTSKCLVKGCDCERFSWARWTKKYQNFLAAK